MNENNEKENIIERFTTECVVIVSKTPYPS